MTAHDFGNPKASLVLIQPVDDHDLSAMAREEAAIRERTDADFHLIAVRMDRWLHDLSPWRAPAVFGREDFGDGAGDTLAEILERWHDPAKTYCIGGYSLAGLFSLWASYQTDAFSGVAAASPSLWFPGFQTYMDAHGTRSRAVYLSLGDREEKTRNPVLATAGDCIRKGYETLEKQGISCILEWNEGNHFREPELRMAKAFAWAIRAVKERKGGNDGIHND